VSGAGEHKWRSRTHSSCATDDSATHTVFLHTKRVPSLSLSLSLSLSVSVSVSVSVYLSFCSPGFRGLQVLNPLTSIMAPNHQITGFWMQEIYVRKLFCHDHVPHWLYVCLGILLLCKSLCYWPNHACNSDSLPLTLPSWHPIARLPGSGCKNNIWGSCFNMIMFHIGCMYV
jgi:hypothetical protein